MQSVPKIKIKQHTMFERGLYDGTQHYGLSVKISADIAMSHYGYIKKFERDAYSIGYELGLTGKYFDEYKYGDHLGSIAEKNKDIQLDGWEYYHNSYGFISAELI